MCLPAALKMLDSISHTLQQSTAHVDTTCMTWMGELKLRIDVINSRSHKTASRYSETSSQATTFGHKRNFGQLRITLIVMHVDVISTVSFLFKVLIGYGSRKDYLDMRGICIPVRETHKLDSSPCVPFAESEISRTLSKRQLHYSFSMLCQCSSESQLVTLVLFQSFLSLSPPHLGFHSQPQALDACEHWNLLKRKGQCNV